MALKRMLERVSRQLDEGGMLRCRWSLPGHRVAGVV